MKKENKVKFKIVAPGCKVNQYNSAVSVNILSSANFVKREPSLGLIIIKDGNYCSVKVPNACEQLLNKTNTVKVGAPQKLICKIINYKL